MRTVRIRRKQRVPLVVGSFIADYLAELANLAMWKRCHDEITGGNFFQRVSSCDPVPRLLAALHLESPLGRISDGGTLTLEPSLPKPRKGVFRACNLPQGRSSHVSYCSLSIRLPLSKILCG